MKTKQLLPFLLLLLMVGGLAHAQQTATLVCDIEALEDGSDPADVCYFAEDPEENPENFTLDVLVGEEITWSGEGPIVIRKIQHYGGKNIFKKDPEGNGKVKAKPNKATDGEPYRYKIHFKIDGKGKNYKIDPIIRSKQQ